MNNLERIRKTAQAQANRDGKPLAILNLNQYSPLYVIRQWDDRYLEACRSFAERIDPVSP